MAGTGNTDRTATKHMIEFYRDHHRKAMDDAQENIADWGWVDLKSLLDFLQSLKDKADGVRIYFAAHKDDVEQRQKHYRGYNTVVLVGTKKIEGTDKNIDLKETNFTEATDYALSAGKNSLGVNDDYDKTHIHPPEDDDNGDTILQEVISSMKEMSQKEEK